MAVEKEVWEKQLANKTVEEEAEIILQNLIGYSKKSSYRKEDIQSLVNVIEIFRAEWV